MTGIDKRKKTVSSTLVFLVVKTGKIAQCMC